MSGDFRLSATLRGHEEDVRAIVFPSSDLLFSASRDNTVRQWKQTSTKPPTYDDTIALQGAHWFNGLAIAPASKECPNGVIAAGGRETFVFVKQVGAPPEEDPHRLLIGHAGNIACLAFSEDGSKIISGGWDSQVFVWDVESGSVVAELKGHQGPVWAILVYDAKTIVTACADKVVRIFDIKSGKVLQSLQGHTDVARALCKLPAGHWSGAALASAGNDEVIRLWTLDGLEVGQLEGHTAYIYDLAILPNGDIVSSSEDRTVRLWRSGQCIQTITHPAISIWTVEACENGDIASGASDKMIRIFSRDPERQADAEAIAAFEESNRMHAIPAQTANQGLPFEKETLPGPEALHTQTGQKDGQQLLIRENDGSVTAHLWSSSTGQWNLIGTVVEGEGTGTAKKVHNGKEYDYVFDIDIEDGKPPLKLPYNLTESAWDAARRFLTSNELPMTYFEQVANWITENTKGTTMGDPAPANQAPPPGSDPYGTERRYRPGDAPSGPRRLPQKSYVSIVEGNPANAINIITQKTRDMFKSGEINAEQGLDADEDAALKALPAQLQNKQDPQPTAVQVNALLKAASQWPQKSRVPAVGVLAVCAVSPSFVSATSADGKTIIDILTTAGLLQPRQETANNVVHTIRLLVNLFKSDAGRKIMDDSFDSVLQLVRPFASEPESPAQVKALATLYLNFAVLLISGSAPKASESRASTLLTDIAVSLECESPHAADPDALFRTLTALGTLIHLSNEFKQSLKGGISGSLHFVAAKPAAQAPEVKEIIQEVRDELR